MSGRRCGDAQGGVSLSNHFLHNKLFEDDTFVVTLSGVEVRATKI